MQRFDNRHAVVTGAGGGMGLAIATALLAEGARVTMLDKKARPDGLSGGEERVLYACGDITHEAFVHGTLDVAAARFGSVDHLVNAAGVLWIGQDRSALTVETDVWRSVIDINLTACMLMVRHAGPHLSDGASMVHVSSTQCYRGDDVPQDAYQVAKAGVIALSKSLAIQLASRGIRSNVLVPGPTRTPMQERWDADPEGEHRVAGVIPLGRVGRPQDMADAVLFLLSEQASFITGTELIVDGGLLARP